MRSRSTHGSCSRESPRGSPVAAFAAETILLAGGPWAGGYRRCAHGYMLLPLSRPRTIWKDTGSHHLNGWRGQEALPLPTFLSCIMSSEAQDEFIEAAPEGLPAGLSVAFSAQVTSQAGQFSNEVVDCDDRAFSE